MSRPPFSSSARPRARTLALSIHLALMATCLTQPVSAAQTSVQDASRKFDFSIPSGSLSNSIHTLSRQSQILISSKGELLRNKTSQGLNGTYSIEEALRLLLSETGLKITKHDDGSYLLEPVSLQAYDTLTVVGAEQKFGQANYVATHSSAGTKVDSRILETPQSISVVTSDRIRNIGATRLKDALSYTPGINTSPWGDNEQYDWLYVRGFDAYNPGFYLDGLQMRNNGNWGQWQTESYGQERIEVMRGPASVLYGQNGPGGIVNIASKTPSATPSKEISVQAGSNNHKQLSADLTGPVDKDGEWLYRLTAVAKDSEIATEEMDNDRLYIAPSLTWQPSADTSLTLLSQFMRHRGSAVWHGYPLEGTLLDNPNGDIPVSTLLGEPDFNRYDQDQWMLGYAFEHRLNDTWRFQQNARYGEFDLDYRVAWGRWAKPDQTNPANPDNFRTLNRTPLKSVEDVSSFTVDNRLIAEFDQGGASHTLLFGLDYQYADLDVVANYGGTLAPLDLFNPEYGSSVSLNPAFIDARTRLTQTGFYLQDMIRFQHNWILTVGGRYDRAEVKNHDRLSGERSTQSDDAFTARAGLVYESDNGLAPYISYAESFLPSSQVNPVTQQPFSPENGQQYEIGVRYQPSDTALYSVAAFDLTREDYVVWDWTNSPPGPKQTGEINVQGMEFEAITQPTDNLNLTASYTWIPKADVVKSANPSEVGKQDKAVSEHQWSLWGDYRFNSGITLGLGARHTGSNQGTGEKAPREVPPYTLYDAMISYQLKDWRFALNARNLSDETYLTGCGDRDCFYGERRKVTASATYRW